MQLSTLSQWLAGIAGAKDRTQLRGMISPLADRCSSNPINSAGLAIKTGGGHAAHGPSKVTNALQAFFTRVLTPLLASAMPVTST